VTDGAGKYRPIGSEQGMSGSVVVWMSDWALLNAKPCYSDSAAKYCCCSSLFTAYARRVTHTQLRWRHASVTTSRVFYALQSLQIRSHRYKCLLNSLLKIF